MKYKLTLITLSLLTIISCENKQENFSCSYYGTAQISNINSIVNQGVYGFSSNQEATLLVNKIVSFVGLSINFEITPSQEVDNAAALIYNGKRYIIYNNDFMNIAEKITNNSWSSISILAHEIGHHLQGHTLSNDGSRPTLELEADKFSGFVLAKMGASLQDAQISVLTLVSSNSSSTHPPKSERLRAIAIGYNQGIEQNRSVSSQLPKNEGKPITNTPANTIEKSKELNEETSSSNLIRIGKHNFTLQWISWEHPGTIKVMKIGNNKFSVEGKQLSTENDDYIYINGAIEPINNKELRFDGVIRYMVSYINNGKECVKDGRQIFKATGERKYWRLQNMTNCEGGGTTDYIDIYF